MRKLLRSIIRARYIKNNGYHNVSRGVNQVYKALKLKKKEEE